MADYIASLINLVFLIFGAFLGFGIDLLFQKVKDRNEISEKKRKYIKSILFELDTNDEILHTTYRNNLGVLPLYEVITGLISSGDIIFFDNKIIDELMMYRRELQITINIIQSPNIIIQQEFGESNLYRASQRLKGVFLDLQKSTEIKNSKKKQSKN